MTGQQLQLPAVIHGAVNAAAGMRAKDRGMAQAADATPAPWAARCDNAIREMASRGAPFQAADLIAEGLVDEPPSPAQWGPRFGHAARRGVIRQAGSVPSKRVTVHRSLCRQWIGTGTEVTA